MGEPARDSRYLEDLVVGERAERRHVVSAADVDAFAAVSGDHNPLHMDEAYAQNTQFKGRIAHGMLAAAYISAVLGNDLPGPGGIYVSQSVRFKRPVRIGDEVTTRVEVKSLDARRGVAVFSTVCLVGGKTVVDGEATVMLPRRPAGEAA